MRRTDDTINILKRSRSYFAEGRNIMGLDILVSNKNQITACIGDVSFIDKIKEAVDENGDGVNINLAKILLDCTIRYLCD